MMLQAGGVFEHICVFQPVWMVLEAPSNYTCIGQQRPGMSNKPWATVMVQLYPIVPGPRCLALARSGSHEFCGPLDSRFPLLTGVVSPDPTLVTQVERYIRCVQSRNIE